MTSHLREPFRRPTTEAPPARCPRRVCRLAGVRGSRAITFETWPMCRRDQAKLRPA